MGDVLLPIGFFAAVVLAIVLPVYSRNRLREKQLDTVAIAMEKGIEPERIRESLPLAEKVADVNGNWKAGVIMVGIAVVYIVMMALQMAFAGGADAKEGVMAFFPGVLLLILGVLLIYIHRTIIGAVKTPNYNSNASNSSGKGGESSGYEG